MHQQTESDSDFIRRFKAGTDGLEAFSVGACPGCDECGLADVGEYDDDPDRCQVADEPHFSWSPCEICGQHLGGNRHPGHFIESGQVQHLDCCTDCLLFAANGTLPSEGS